MLAVNFAMELEMPELFRNVTHLIAAARTALVGDAAQAVCFHFAAMGMEIPAVLESDFLICRCLRLGGWMSAGKH